jgi:protein-S-isoprenylcysteine O-methyltransferase Ste14
MTRVADSPSSLSASGAATRPSQRKADILAAILWAGLASIQVSVLLAKPSLLQFGLALSALTLPLLFIIRRPARAQGPRHTFWLAVFGTFLPIGTLRPGGVGWQVPGEVVQIIGFGIILVAVWTLNRSFGLAPAHRGLVTRGVYRLVRHPLYAGELLALAGYCLGYASVWNWLVLAATAAIQVARMFAEEKLLAEDGAYRDYRARVRWRLLPGIW